MKFKKKDERKNERQFLRDEKYDKYQSDLAKYEKNQNRQNRDPFDPESEKVVAPKWDQLENNYDMI